MKFPEVLIEKKLRSLGKMVEWTSPGKAKKVIKGKISSPHGSKGLVRGIFEKGLPGQARNDDVEIGE